MQSAPQTFLSTNFDPEKHVGAGKKTSNSECDIQRNPVECLEAFPLLLLN